MLGHQPEAEGLLAAVCQSVAPLLFTLGDHFRGRVEDGVEQGKAEGWRGQLGEQEGSSWTERKACTEVGLRRCRRAEGGSLNARKGCASGKADLPQVSTARRWQAWVFRILV